MCVRGVQVVALKKEVLERKARERLLEQRNRHLERERDCIQALWEAEKSRHNLMQKAMFATLASAGSDLAGRGGELNPRKVYDGAA